ncbi:cytochrome P450 10-like isoform X2 [Physella acuta]|nr:cytochrome P450 10-like isoform X2 [Physella acuta]
MKVQTSFLRPGSADPYVPDLGLVTDDLVTYFERGHSQGDARDVIFLYILECLFQFCFNRRLGALTPHGAEENNETVTQMRALISTLARPPVIKLHRLWKTKAYTNVENSMNHLIGLAQSEVKLAFERLSANQKRDPDSPHLIESLLTQTDLTPEEVVRSMSDFFFGGADTTSKNLGMLLFHMAKYTDQQEMLYQEIKASIGSNILVTPRDLAKMEFMNACVKESMRLAFPLAPGPARVIPQDLVLSGYRVPKGTLVMLCNTACLHDPALVHDPDGFRPERWLRNRDRMKNETIPTVCYLPFGIGVRMCLGKRFAEQIMRLCLVKLVQKYELRLIDDPKDINITYQIFPTIDRPLRIQFIPRPT